MIEYSKFKSYLALPVLLICYIVLLCSTITNVEAANVLTLDNTSPPQVIIGEHYSWRIPISGGTGPYRYQISGDLPNALYDSTTGYIVGTATLPQNKSAYQVTISVRDCSDSYTEQIYIFSVFYSATISFHGSIEFRGETNVEIDGVSQGKVIGRISMLFPVNETHSAKVEPIAYDTTDNNTRYVFQNTYIYPISNSSTNAVFTFVTEYQIKASTKPEGIYSLFSSDWYSLSNWYRDGSQISYDAPSEVQYSYMPDTKYHFSNWTLPGNQRQIENNLVLTINKGGEIIANYNTLYKLTIDSPYGADIEGEGFYPAGDTAKWRIKGHPPQAALDFIGYNLGVKQEPDQTAGEVKMDYPRVIYIKWHYDYSSSPILDGLIVTIVGGPIVWLIIRYLAHKKQVNNGT